MASFGLELVFRSAVPPIGTKQDCLIAFIHWKLLAHGFSCVPSSQVLVKPEQVTEVTELLPTDWNSTPDVYEIHYMKDGKKYILKGNNVDGQLIVTVVRLLDEQVTTVTLDHDFWIGASIQNFRETFKDMPALAAVIESDLISPFSEKKKPAPAAERPQQPPPPPEDDPSRYAGSSAYRRDEGFQDPFAVGRGDLDPFGRGMGGGLLMDPRHRIGVGRPQPGIPGNLPPGAVPPGSRFDPFGPVPPEQIPWGGGRFGQPRPRGGGGFGDPDPNHLPPPGSHDMFM